MRTSLYSSICVQVYVHIELYNPERNYSIVVKPGEEFTPPIFIEYTV